MLSSSKASNWVDRGEPADARVAQVVAHFLDVPDAARAVEPWLADAARELVAPARVVAVGIWHAVKAAEVRDRAEQVLRTMAADTDAPPPPLAEWLAERMLTPEELRLHREQRATDGGDDQ